MDKDKLSPREEAFLAAARREAARKERPPSAQPASAPAEAQAARQAKPALTPAERLEQLMAAERAESALRKQRLRRYGLTGAAVILALFALWLLRAFRRR